MPRAAVIIILLLCLLSQFSYGDAGRQDETKNVLILLALNPGTPAYHKIIDGIREELNNEYGDTYNLYAEYLEVNRFPKDDYPKERFDLYNEKYRDVSLDILICVGFDIITTVKNRAEKYLLDLPTVSVDYDFSSYGYRTEILLNNKTVAIALKVDAGRTINSAFELFPDATNVLFICGVSSNDSIFLDISRQEAEKIDSRKKVEFLNDVSMDEALRLVSHLPDNSIIFIPAFNMDSKLVPYYSTESIRLISSSANAPVFTYSDTGFGDGAVGGYIVSFKETGSITGETAVKILKGSDPNSITISEDNYYGNYFDWRELRRWGIADSKLLPKDSTILFKESSIFEKYKWIIIAGILFLLFQTFLIFNLIIMYRKSRFMTNQIQESENKYRELLREDRVLRIGQLTASLSHELNQPLTAILSTAQAGLRFINSNSMNPDLMKEILQNIVEDDKRSAAILSSIRGMLKLEKREKEIVNLNDAIEELVAIYRSEALVHKISMNMDLTAEPIFVFADRIQIQQVILNFISNAFHSMDKVNVDKKFIYINESVNAGIAVVSVRDFGVGIEDSVKDRIFKPFVTSKREGLGIGLAISRSIIEDHKGEIWARNMPDGGAEFSFSLKIHHDEK